jgi:hypothetical protein
MGYDLNMKKINSKNTRVVLSTTVLLLCLVSLVSTVGSAAAYNCEGHDTDSAYEGTYTSVTYADIFGTSSGGLIQSADFSTGSYYQWPQIGPYETGLWVHYWGNNWEVPAYQYAAGTYDHQGSGSNLGSTQVNAEAKQCMGLWLGPYCLTSWTQDALAHCTP